MHDKNLPPITTNEEKEKTQFKVTAVDQEDGDKGFVGEEKENIGMKSQFNETIGQDAVALDELEDKIDDVNRRIIRDEDNAKPLTLGGKIDRCLPQPDKMSIRPPLTKEEKIRMINMIFPISLGDQVKNKHGEKGYVESVCIDHRGVLYLVSYQKHEIIWESSYQIKKISPYFATESDHIGKDRPNIPKTDIPDSRTVKTDPSQI